MSTHRAQHAPRSAPIKRSNAIEHKTEPTRRSRRKIRALRGYESCAASLGCVYCQKAVLQTRVDDVVLCDMTGKCDSFTWLPGSTHYQ